MNIAEKIAEFFLHARQTAEMLPDGSGTVDGMPLPPLTSRPVQDNGPFAPQIVHMPCNLFICYSYNSTDVWLSHSLSCAIAYSTSRWHWPPRL